ncbi:uncharacterized protein UTRI_05351_B [Ustilago trichophora]|uniref:Uncharacterized protein n=1 Tax=Ustilago trichophora TaxID=86804 RepID=A0A5C3EKN6_9BASI|nr:uncharacterized protein UTRI_05351_B [Ustilago trichophora]
MSHISILSAPLPSITRTSEDDAYFTSQASSSKQSLTVPESFLRPSRSRSNSIHPKQNATSSLPGSPVASSFPQRPAFRRAVTSSAATSVSTAESTRFDDLHYSQTHFSRSTLIVYPDSETTVQACSGPEPEEDIRELLLASSDEESSAPPSTPGFDSARIPPRGSSASFIRNKQSMESEKSTLSLPEPITLLAPPAAQNSPLRRNGLKMSQSSTELACEAPRASMNSHHDARSIRSNASSAGSFKRRSRILMKIIPFARESSSAASPLPDHGQKFSTFPRIRSKVSDDEPMETLAARISDLNTDPLSPPLSATSVKSTFSSITGGMVSSSPATSPEMGHPDLPGTHRSGSHDRRDGCRLKGTSSLESVRSLFSSSSSQSLNTKALEESEWEKTLEDAASRASWHSSINHRPRQHTLSNASSSKKPSHKRNVSNQSTWPRAISNPVHQRDSLLLEHVFVDASDDGSASQYAASSYSGYPVGDDGGWSVAGSRQHSFAWSNYSAQSRPAYIAPMENAGQGRFGTLPRVKTRRPSTTGTSFRGEPAQFELKPPSLTTPPSRSAALGTASLGRATSLRRRAVPDAASIWHMGRRRSSGIGFHSNNGSFSGGGTARMMPTIPQGHSRETSLADSVVNDETPSWAGIDPYTQDPAEPHPRGYSISSSARQDSLASDGSGDFIPLRVFPARRESQDDLALLNFRRRSSNSSTSANSTNDPAATRPVFNLHPFQKRPQIGRSFSSQEAFRRHADVPEPVTSETEDGNLRDDGEGWCRRRSSFTTSLVPAPSLLGQV